MQPLVRTSLLVALAFGAASCRSTVVGTARSSDGVEIVYSDRGEGDPPLVLVHGWSCQRTQWSDVDGELARKHRVVELDLGGHGDSGGAERGAWTLSLLGDDVASVLDALDLHGAVLIGHSLGGPVALAAAGKRPERVAGVIGVDTFHDGSRKPDPKMMQGFLEKFRGDFRGSMQEFLDGAFSPEADPALKDRVWAGIDRVDPAVSIALMESMASYDMGAAMREAQVPIYSINAETQPTNIEGNRALARWFDVRFVPGVGHWVMMEAPETFVRLVDELLADLAAREPAELRTSEG